MHPIPPVCHDGYDPASYTLLLFFAIVSPLRQRWRLDLFLANELFIVTLTLLKSSEKRVNRWLD